MKKGGSATLLFDFDGTLVDSFDASVAATNRVLGSRGFDSVSRQEVAEAMRFSAEGAFAHHSGIEDGDLLAEMVDAYYSALENSSLDIKCEEPILDFIREYRGKGLLIGIVSNNRVDFIRRVLSTKGIDNLFDVVIGDGEGYVPKPSPEGIRFALDRLAVPHWQAAYIGDGASDAEAARLAGVFSIGVTWIRDRHHLVQCDRFPRVVGSALELKQTLDRWTSMVFQVKSPDSFRSRLYFMRHCESEANAADILASRIDYQLSDKGKRQAERIASAMVSRFDIDVVCSSPLLRARQTAEIIAEKNSLAIELDDLLQEQELGVFSGLSYAEIQQRNDYQHDRMKRWNWKPQSGESYREIYERVLAFFFVRVLRNQGNSVLFVTHAVTMRLVRALLENSAPDYPERIPGNGEVWEVLFDAPGVNHEIIEHQLFNPTGKIHRA